MAPPRKRPNRRNPPTGRRGSGQSQLRIIGGQWRGRKLSFTAAEGLRPTADRVRETLFNWLAAEVHGARCADLFAGSGALGLEALSRGAAHVDFCDTNRDATGAIGQHLQTLGAAHRARVHALQAQELLQQQSQPWDIVFVDPPFGRELAAPILQQLAARELLAPGALVYLETARQEALPELPAGWSVRREKSAGNVCSRLIVCGLIVAPGQIV